MTNSLNDVPPFKANAVALKLFLHIANEWQLTPVQRRQLFSFLTNQQYEAWMSGELNSEHTDLLTLVSQLMNIYKQLHQIFAVPIQANRWILKSNSALQGLSGFDLILQKSLVGATDLNSYLASQGN